MKIIYKKGQDGEPRPYHEGGYYPTGWNNFYEEMGDGIYDIELENYKRPKACRWYGIRVIICEARVFFCNMLDDTPTLFYKINVKQYNPISLNEAREIAWYKYIDVKTGGWL